MTKITSKIAVAFIALTVLVAVGASTASAQSMSLSDLINAFIKAGIISADKAAAAQAIAGASVSTTFTKDLTVGSSGAEVSALQSAVGITPATGYFGSATKAAVMKFQAANGVPATGYVGALTRAALNKTSGSSVVSNPVSTGSTAIVNSGVEGTITVEKSSVSNTTVYEGDTMHAILGIKVQAKVSDINVQRVKLNLGSSTSFYTKVFKTLYVTDDSGKVLVQADLNSNTVVKDSSEYYITLGGFSYNVPKDSTKYLWIKADAYSAIKVADQTSRTITLPADGVRGTDGAGIDQYGPASSLNQVVTISGSLTDSATIDLSTNSANFKSTDVVAKDGANNNEIDKLSLLSFDLRANKADVKVTDLNVSVTATGGTATTTTVYLYDGATLIQSESVDTTGANAGKATFNDLSNLIVGKDSTKTLTVKADVRSANSTVTNVTASVATVTAENLAGTTATASGSSTGNAMSVRNVGPVFSLVGSPTVVKSASASQNNTSTSTLTATFTVKVTALGAAITFGDNGSSTPMFGQTPSFFKIYRDGSVDSTVSSNATSTSFTIPSDLVTVDSNNANSWVLARNNSMDIPVSFTIEGRKTTGAAFTTGNYAVQLAGIRWQSATTGTQTSTFMDTQSAWRSSSVVLP